ncbi:hypothetical protein JCM11641_005333 [Rhodosporidiobolus odoratus]
MCRCDTNSPFAAAYSPIPLPISTAPPSLPYPPAAIDIVPPTPATSSDSHYPSQLAANLHPPMSMSKRPTLRKKLSDSLLSLRAFGDSFRTSLKRTPSSSSSSSSSSSARHGPYRSPSPSHSRSPSPPESALSCLISRFASSPPVKLTLIFVDLSLPPSPTTSGGSTSPYQIHLQLYLRLSTSGSARAALDRFDLDSNSNVPCPSGRVGAVEVVRRQQQALPTITAGVGGALGLRPTISRESSASCFASSFAGSEGEKDFEKDTAVENGEVTEVRFVLTPEVANVRNLVDDSTKEGRFWMPGKGVVVSSWVSVEGVSLSFILGSEARYHEASHISDSHRPLPPSYGPLTSSDLPHRYSPSNDHHMRKSSSTASLSTLSSLTTSLSPVGTPHPMRTSKHTLEGLDWRSVFVNVRKGREVLLERTVKVNPLHGAAIGANVVSTVDTPTIFHPDHDLAISYGFFDSGIARAKQMYVYAARRSTTWLSALIEEDPRVLEVPLEKLALAGSHDAGMIGAMHPALLQFLDRGDGSDIPSVALALPFVRFLIGLVKTFGGSAARMLSNMSNTQKDSIRFQLEMGVRFFDFRPGYSLFDIVDEVKGELRHQHSIVPGVGYEMFLMDVLGFLAKNEREIVVVELKDDGFPFRSDIFPDAPSPSSSEPPLPPLKPVAISMVPSSSELFAALSAAKASSSLAAREVQVGSAKDLQRSIGELLEKNQRLIIIDRIHEEELKEAERWSRGDSYTHKVYDTDNPLKVLAALNAAQAEAASRAARRELGGMRGSIYQLQATPTAQLWADIGPSLSYSDAASLLVWSKARMDRVTYPWLAQRAFVEAGLVIFLNDFVDPALVEHCVEKSKERIAVFLAKRDNEVAAALAAPSISSRRNSVLLEVPVREGL